MEPAFQPWDIRPFTYQAITRIAPPPSVSATFALVKSTRETLVTPRLIRARYGRDAEEGPPRCRTPLVAPSWPNNLYDPENG